MKDYQHISPKKECIKMLTADQRYDIVSRCLMSWAPADDEKTTSFEENFDEWIEQISAEAQPIVIELLKDFEYFSQPKVNQFLKKLHNMLISIQDFDVHKAIFTYLPSKRGIDNSSIEYLLNYKKIHSISKFDVATNLETYTIVNKEVFKNKKHIVFIDDFCGSGRTFIDFIKGHLDILTGKTIYYVITYIMTEAIKNIQNEATERSLQVKILFCNQSDKAFDKHLFPEKTEVAREKFYQASLETGVKEDSIWGYSGSESLVSFYNDTPNNTLGLFWHDSPNYFSIFPRENACGENNKRPTPRSMKKQKTERNNQNYIAHKRSALNG